MIKDRVKFAIGIFNINIAASALVQSSSSRWHFVVVVIVMFIGLMSWIASIEERKPK
jgi:hypothetical protein